MTYSQIHSMCKLKEMQEFFNLRCKTEEIFYYYYSIIFQYILEDFCFG